MSYEPNQQLITPLPDRPDYRDVQPEYEPSFDIKLDGQVIGTIYPRRLKGAAQIDLEDAQTTRQVIRWLVVYAGGNGEKVEAVLRELPINEVTTFVKNVATALQQSLDLGKVKGSR